MKADLILRDKVIFTGGYIQEIVIWRLSEPVKGSQHHYKYRLFFGLPNQRIIGYDNERPKGDHRHYGNREEFYTFTSPQQLIQDFLADVSEYRKTHHDDTTQT